MKTLRHLAWFASACAIASAQQNKLSVAGGALPATDLVLAITGTTVIDVASGSNTPSANVVIRAGRIETVNASAEFRPPANATVVNAKGKFLVPGLWDLHTHIQNPRELDVFFPLLVALGVVGIRDAEGLLPAEFHELGKRHRFVPRVFACGTYIDGPAPAGVDAAAIVDDLADKGVDFIKVGSMLSRDRFMAIIARARDCGLHVCGHLPIAVPATEASDAGLRTIEHLWEIALNASAREATLRAERLAALGRKMSIAEQELELAFPRTEPLTSTWDEEKASAVFKKFVANRTWQTPTLVNFAVRGPALGGEASFWSDPNLALMPGDWVDSWRPQRNQFLSGVPAAEVPAYVARFKATHQAQLELVRRLRAAGVRFLAGTDISNWNFTVPGTSLHDELALFVRAGFSPLEALQTATTNAVEYLGLTESEGAVVAGKRANLLILDADPTADIENVRRIHAVVIGGQLINRKQLDAILDDARERAKRPAPGIPNEKKA